MTRRILPLLMFILFFCLIQVGAQGKPWAPPISVKLIGFEPPDAEPEPLLPFTPDKKTHNPKDSAEIVYIPAGKFVMGYGGRRDGMFEHLPTLYVEVSGYYFYKNLVTVRQYRKYCRMVGKEFPDYRRPEWDWHDDHPMVNVSWKEARDYCVWAGGDLPTEAQWEKAACWDEKEQRSYAYPWGDGYDLRRVWASNYKLGDAGGTIEVGKYGVSPYGITDMAGNVWQWCRDWFDPQFWSGRAAERLDPVNTSVGEKKYRVVRGGSWMQSHPDYFRSQFRTQGDPVRPMPGYGFRCVLPVDTQ